MPRRVSGRWEGGARGGGGAGGGIEGCRDVLAPDRLAEERRAQTILLQEEVEDVEDIGVGEVGGFIGEGEAVAPAEIGAEGRGGGGACGDDRPPASGGISGLGEGRGLCHVYVPVFFDPADMTVFNDFV